MKCDHRLGLSKAARRRKAAFRVLILFCLAALSRSTALAEDWPGWRGGTKEARGQGPGGSAHAPAGWNIVWKIAIPGDGYSSPIVSGNAVYVTGARIIPAKPLSLRIARIALVSGLALFLALAVRYAVRRARDAKGWLPIAGSALFLCASAVAAGLVLYGESVLDFGRAVERPWAAGGLSGTLLLVLFSVYAGTPRSCLTGGVLLLLLSATLAATVPDTAHSVRAGFLNPLSLFVYCVIGMPLGPGLALITTWIRAIAAKSAPSARRDRVAILVRWAALGIGVAAIAILIRLSSGDSAQVARAYATSGSYKPVLRWWLLPIELVILIGLLAISARRQGQPSIKRTANVLSSFIGALFAVSAAAVGIEMLLRRIPFLYYMLGKPDALPILGGVALIALGAAALMGTVAGFFPAGRREGAWTSVFLLAALLLTIVYLGYAIYLPKDPMLERCVVRLDRATGRIEWIASGMRARRGTLHNLNSPATPTPVTDGKRLYAYFGTHGVQCVDAGGHKRWLNTQLPFESREGVAGSPVLAGGRVLILSESDAGSFLAALDSETGGQVWRTVRHQPLHAYAGNCRTPTVARVRGRLVAIVWGSEDLSVYDIANGKELASHPLGNRVRADNPVACAAMDEGRLVLVGSSRALCVRVDDLLDADLPVEWERDLDYGVQVSTPVATGGAVFATSDSGDAFALDLRDGKERWHADLGGQHYASPVSDRRAVYFCSTEGWITTVSTANPPTTLSRGNQGEGIYATPALVDGSIFIRTTRYLYRIDNH